jgi:hypothetical protein
MVVSNDGVGVQTKNRIEYLNESRTEEIVSSKNPNFRKSGPPKGTKNIERDWILTNGTQQRNPDEPITLLVISRAGYTEESPRGKLPI